MNDIPRRGPMLGGMMDVPMLISEMIRYAADFHGQVEVVGRKLDHSIERSSWLEIHRRAARTAHALQARGYDENARIATLAWNTLDHLVLFYAVLGLGIPLHTLNPRLSFADLAYMADLVEDDLCFFDSGNLELAIELASITQSIRAYVFLGDAIPAEAAHLPGIITIETFLGDASDEIDWPIFDENRAATICFTSGTTGKPKGVAYSHRSITLSALNMSSASMYAHSVPGEAETVLPVAAMYHANAWMMPFTAPMNGQKLVLPGRRLDAEAIVDLIIDEQVTLAGAIPTIWLDIVTELKKRGVRRTGLRTALVAGVTLPEATAKAMLDHGITPRQSWGMTEVPGAAQASPPRGSNLLTREEQLRLSIERQGRVALTAQLRIVDESGHRLPQDGKAKGFLQVRGATVCGRYIGERTEPTSWLDTGDIAILYPDSTIAIVDRAKDAIKSGGEWISSPQLEAAAMQHPGVSEAAAIAMPHSRWQERPLLVCVGTPNAQRPDDTTLKACMASHVAKWWLPDQIEWIDQLPRTATGKLDKATLRKIMGVDQS
jgi:acyl-CoA synthetase (AMP-forming)/AMP-acid ligase II